MKKQYLIAGSTIILTIVGICLLFLWVPQNQKEITAFAIAHPLLAPIIIIVSRIVGIVIPPIPGGVVSLALIPVLGWFWSYLYATIGSIIGSTLAFFIARRFREPIAARFVPLQDLQKWEAHVSGKTEFLAFLGVRFLTGPVMDFVSYAAGLSRLSYWRFILATVISQLPLIATYYVGDAVYSRASQEMGLYGVIGIIVAVGVLWYGIKPLRGKNASAYNRDMRLPNRDRITIKREKLTNYLLSLTHHRGKSKAKFFRKIGFNEENMQDLRQALVSIGKTNVVKSVQHEEKIDRQTKKKITITRYVVEGVIKAPNGKQYTIQTVWAIDSEDDILHLATARPKV